NNAVMLASARSVAILLTMTGNARRSAGKRPDLRAGRSERRFARGAPTRRCGAPRRVVELEATYALHAPSRTANLAQQTQQQLLAGTRPAARVFRGDADVHHRDMFDVFARVD